MKTLLIGLLAIGSISAFANCSVSFNVYDSDGNLHSDQRLVEAIVSTAKKSLKENGVEILTNREADYQLGVGVSYIAFQFDGTRGVPVDGFAVAVLKNSQDEILFKSEVKRASSFLFIPARYDRIVSKAVKKALKEVSCPERQ